MMLDKIFELYRRVLEAHIKTKTTSPLFHEKSAGFYELLFDVFHQIAEKRQDTELDDPEDCCELISRTYEDIEEVKSMLEKSIKAGGTVGMDNLLRGLVDRLESACGTARGFLEQEDEEYEDDEERTEVLDITKLGKNPLRK